MPSHKKHPIFLRIVANDQVVTCLNPLELSTFQILQKAQILVKKADPKDPASKNEYKEADTIRFYFPSGTGLSYSVGIDMTQQEFDYVCGTLLEFLYLNQSEFEARTKAIEQERMTEWNKISEENSEKQPTATVPTGT